MDFFFNGYYVVIGGDDRIVKLWDLCKFVECVYINVVYFVLVFCVRYEKILFNGVFFISFSYDGFVVVYFARDFVSYKKIGDGVVGKFIVVDVVGDVFIFSGFDCIFKYYIK